MATGRAGGIVVAEDALGEATDMVYWAWTIIANAGVHLGGWDSQHPDWVNAAIQWRDEYHKLIPRWIELMEIEHDEL